MIIPNPTWLWLPYLNPYNFGNERVTSGPSNKLKNDPIPHQVKTVIGVIDGIKNEGNWITPQVPTYLFFSIIFAHKVLLQLEK